MRYDDIQNNADRYMNNAFLGTWQMYDSELTKKCNWGDYRVPDVSDDFDIGAGEFYPNPEYNNQGWENYNKALLQKDEEARKIEMEKWW